MEKCLELAIVLICAVRGRTRAVHGKGLSRVRGSKQVLELCLQGAQSCLWIKALGFCNASYCVQPHKELRIKQMLLLYNLLKITACPESKENVLSSTSPPAEPNWGQYNTSSENICVPIMSSIQELNGYLVQLSPDDWFLLDAGVRIVLTVYRWTNETGRCPMHCPALWAKPVAEQLYPCLIPARFIPSFFFIL